MKKYILKIGLLSVSFLLAACETTNPDLSSSPVDSGSSNAGTSSSVTPTPATSSSSSGDQNPTAWTSSDIAAMKEYLNGYDNIPFPTGITSAYVEASGTDEYGECFIIYDSYCGDLTASYGKQLISAGFSYDEESYEDGYYFYYYDIEDTNDSIYVQTDYYEGDFEIFAWYETGDTLYKDFPYALIAEFLGKDSVDENVVPSFALADGESYGAYSSGTEYLLVYGNYDTSIEEDAYVVSYETKLTDVGYTVDTENWIAVNEEAEIEIEYLAYDGMFCIQVEKYEKVVPPTPGDHAVTLTSEDFGASYGEFTFDKDGVSFAGKSIMSNSSDSSIQFRNAKKGSGILYNTSSMSELTSIVVTMSSNANVQYYGVLSCYVSSSIISDTSKATKVTPSENEGVYTYSIPAGNSYFYLIDETNYASNNASIVFNYTVA